jgi:hypothetical protein
MPRKKLLGDSYARALVSVAEKPGLTVPKIQEKIEVWRLPTMYQIVLVLELKGLLVACENHYSSSQQGRPYRTYSVTEKGKKYATLYKKLFELEEKS